MPPRPAGRIALRAASCLVFALAWASGTRAAVPVPPAPKRFVTDKAGVLSKSAVEALERRLSDFEAQTSNQFLVFIEPKVPEGTTLEEYTVTVAQAWRAGQKERKNGVVLFVFPVSRAARFEVGYGLEGALPDALAGRILDGEVVPRFASGDFEGGVRAGVESAIAATKGEYTGTGRRRSARRSRDRGFPWGLVVLLLVFGLPGLLGRRRRYWYLGGGGFGSGGFGGFGGGDGGGFSGGGGSFGGGGASGRW